MTKHEAQTLRAAVLRLVTAEVTVALRHNIDPSFWKQNERERNLAFGEYEMLLNALTEESYHA